MASGIQSSHLKKHAETGMVASLGTKKMTAIVLRGSVIFSATLTFLIIVHDYFTGYIFSTRVVCGLSIVLYLLIAEFSVKKKHFILAGWMVVSLYTILATAILLTWGLNTPVGILAVSFIVFLSGVMIGPRHIFWIVLPIVVMLLTVQHIHEGGYINPNYAALAKPSRYFDVLVYATILSVFALISWLSAKQTEHSLKRARVAEMKVQTEKESLVEKLEEQSLRLRETQLQEMVSLYKFAAIGQSTTATLHELSNLLSVLTLDIDDIGQQHQRSKAIINAKGGIKHINNLVRQARRQLHDKRNVEVFNAIPVIEQTLKEVQSKFKLKGVELEKRIPQRKSFRITGDTLNISHVLTILLNNALDACILVQHPNIIVKVHQENNTLRIDVIDNGTGVTASQQASLFSPHQSSKPSGLGIGLYITRHIVENQLHGKISFIPSAIGAHFSVELPRHIKYEPET